MRANIEVLIHNYQDIHRRLTILGLFMIFICMGMSKGIGNVSIIAFFIISLANFKWTEFKQNLIRYKHISLIILLFVLFLIGMIYTDDVPQGWKTVRRYHRFLIVPLLFLMNVEIIKSYFKQVLQGYILGVSVIGLLTIILYFLPENAIIFISELTPFTKDYASNHSKLMYGFYSPFYDRLQLSNMLGIATIAALFQFIGNYKKGLNIFSALILIYTSILLGGRAGQLALFFSLFVISCFYVYKWYKKKKNTGKLVIIISSIAFIFIMTPLLLYSFNESVNKRYSQMKWELNMYYNHGQKGHDIMHFTTIRRLVSWQNTWQIAKENILIGVGTGDYENALQEVYNQDTYKLPTNSHSQYLYFWATFGIVGLSIFLFIIFYWFKQLDKNSKEFIPATGFLIFYGIVFMFDIPISEHIDNMTFTILFSAIGIVNKKPVQ